jgi:FKBP-type peptidyl-prolyl cis-trans isomerase
VNRSSILAVLMLVMPIGLAAQDGPRLDSNLQKFSYAMGYRMARDMMQQGVQGLDPDAAAIGLGEAMSGKPFRFSPEEIRAVMAAYQQELVAKRAAEADANKVAGDSFMQANAGKDGVQALDNGIQYKVLADGDGAKPVKTDKVRVHYTGTLLDGTEFDSSRTRGEPTELALGDVIPGWQQALSQMPVGARWMVWIPPEQAYGLRGAGAVIGPNATLSFDIELIEIVAPQ